MSSLLGAQLSDVSKVLLFLPLKLGGAGFQSAALRADGAWVASWAAVEDAVRADQGLPTEAAARAATPRLTAALATARARLGAAGAAAYASTQKEVLQPAIRRVHSDLLRRLASQGDNDGAALVRSAGGEGGAWLWHPSRKEHLLGDDDFIVSLRRRLLVACPGASGGAPCARRATTAGAPC